MFFDFITFTTDFLENFKWITLERRREGSRSEIPRKKTKTKTLRHTEVEWHWKYWFKNQILSFFVQFFTKKTKSTTWNFQTLEIIVPSVRVESSTFCPWNATVAMIFFVLNIFHTNNTDVVQVEGTCACLFACLLPKKRRNKFNLVRKEIDANGIIFLIFFIFFCRDYQVPICPLCSQPIPNPPNASPDETVSRHIDQFCPSERRRIFTNRWVFSQTNSKHSKGLFGRPNFKGREFTKSGYKRERKSKIQVLWRTFFSYSP